MTVSVRIPFDHGASTLVVNTHGTNGASLGVYAGTTLATSLNIQLTLPEAIALTEALRQALR